MFLHALHQLEKHLSVEFVRPLLCATAADRARESPSVLGSRDPSWDAHQPFSARGMEGISPSKVLQHRSPLLPLWSHQGHHVSIKVIPKCASPMFSFGTSGICVVKWFGFL